MVQTLPIKSIMVPLGSNTAFEIYINLEKSLKVTRISKTWMDYCEGLPRSCENLNFPAHLPLITCCGEKSSKLSKKFRPTTLDSQSVEQFCMGTAIEQEYKF